MDYAIIVEMFDSREHLTHKRCCIVLVEFVPGHNSVEHLTTRAVLHHYVDVLVVDVTLMELYDVGVVYLGEDK